MTDLNRKVFIKTCLASACMCRFASFTAGIVVVKSNASGNLPDDDRINLTQEWLKSLLNNLQQNFDENQLRPVIKQSSAIHYADLKMDDMLAPYLGNLGKFIAFIEEKWGWKVTWDKESKKIIADENKEFCVCPVLDSQSKGSSAICFCSEGFAELMFAKVYGAPVKTTVISSVRKGDKSCKYEIILS